MISVERLFSLEEPTELRRNVLRYARAFLPGNERNRHWQVAASLRVLFRSENWLHITQPKARSYRSSESERNLIHRIGLHGAHWKPNVDTCSNHTA